MYILNKRCFWLGKNMYSAPYLQRPSLEQLPLFSKTYDDLPNQLYVLYSTSLGQLRLFGKHFYWVSRVLLKRGSIVDISMGMSKNLVFAYVIHRQIRGSCYTHHKTLRCLVTAFLCASIKLHLQLMLIDSLDQI